MAEIIKVAEELAWPVESGVLVRRLLRPVKSIRVGAWKNAYCKAVIRLLQPDSVEFDPDHRGRLRETETAKN